MGIGIGSGEERVIEAARKKQFTLHFLKQQSMVQRMSSSTLLVVLI